MAACRLVDGLLRVAVRHPKGLYYPEGYYRVGGWKTQTPRLAIGIEEYNAAVLWPTICFYAASGYAPALTLAEGLASFALHQTQGYLPNGAIAPVKAELEDHFHTRGNFMLGILKLGLVSGVVPNMWLGRARRLTRRVQWARNLAGSPKASSTATAKSAV